MSLVNTFNKPITIEIGGKTFEVRQFTLEDFAEFEKFIREERIKLATKISASLPPEEKAVILEKALTSPIDVFKELESIKGTKFVIKKAIRCTEPIGDEEMFQLILSYGLGELLDFMFPKPPVKGEDETPLVGSGESKS